MCWTVVLKKTLESPLDCKEIQLVHPKGDESWVFIGRTDVEAEIPILWPPDAKSWLVGKDPDAGKDWRQEEKGTTEDEMVGWHHWLNGHGFGWSLGVDDGQGGLACCGLRGQEELDMTERLNWTESLAVRNWGREKSFVQRYVISLCICHLIPDVWFQQLLETWRGRSSVVSWISCSALWVHRVSHCMGFERNPQNSNFCSLDYLKNSFLWIKLLSPRYSFKMQIVLWEFSMKNFIIFPQPPSNNIKERGLWRVEGDAESDERERRSRWPKAVPKVRTLPVAI